MATRGCAPSHVSASCLLKDRRSSALWLLLPLVLGCRGEAASDPVQQAETSPQTSLSDAGPEAVLEDLPRAGRDLTLPERPRRFIVELAAQDYFELEVEQRGIDVAVTLTDPRGQEVLTVDSPNGPAGAETLAAVAAEPGRYMLTITPSFEHSGRRVRLGAVVQRPAAEADRHFAGILGQYYRRQEGRSSQSRQRRYTQQTRNLEQLARQDRPLLRGRIERVLGLLCLADGRIRDALGHLERALPPMRSHGTRSR